MDCGNDGERRFAGRDITVEYILVIRDDRDEGHEEARHHGDPCVAAATVADDEGRDDRQYGRRQQLVRYAEERPDDADVALYDQVHPGNSDDEGADDDARLPVAVAEGFIDLAQQFLQQVAAYAAASVDRGSGRKCPPCRQPGIPRRPGGASDLRRPSGTAPADPVHSDRASRKLRRKN